MNQFSIKEHTVNYNLAKQDQIEFHNYLTKTGQNQQIYDGLKRIDENLITDIVYEIKGLTFVGFYNKEDVQKVIDFINECSFKKVFKKDGIMTKQVEKAVSNYIQDNVKCIDFLTFNKLNYHSGGNWISKVN